MKPQFQRILDLVKRTGDRMVVTDRDGDNAYVVMGIDQYEDLLDHSEATLSNFPDDFDHADLDEESVPDLNAMTEDEGRSAAGDIPEDLQKAVEHDLAIIESWEKARAQEEVQKSSKKPDSEPNEEQFYLEPVE